MHEHHVSVINLILAVAVGSVGFWSQAFGVVETGAHVMSTIAPYLAVAVGALQLWLLLRKFFKKH